MTRVLAREEGIFAGISAAGACWVALQLAETVRGTQTIVFVVCDRGDATSPQSLPRVSYETRFCTNCATALAPIRSAEDSGPMTRLRCPALRLDPLGQPDAGAGRGDRAGRPRRPPAARPQRRLARASSSA
jgi:hypothetical protein